MVTTNPLLDLSLSCGPDNPPTRPSMSCLQSLSQRGYKVILSHDGTRFTVEPSAKLRSQPKLCALIRDKREQILAELLAQRDAEQNAQQQAQLDQQRASDVIRGILDPRPDILYDSALWTQLLRSAALADSSLFGPLHGFRCLGAQLCSSVTGFHIVYDATQPGFEDQDDFDTEFRKWFRQNDDFNSRRDNELTALLRSI